MAEIRTIDGKQYSVWTNRWGKECKRELGKKNSPRTSPMIVSDVYQLEQKLKEKEEEAVKIKEMIKQMKASQKDRSKYYNKITKFLATATLDKLIEISNLCK